MARIARDAIAVSTQSGCEAGAALWQGSYVKMASCWRVLGAGCHICVSPVPHKCGFPCLPHIERIPLFVGRDSWGRNGSNPTRCHVQRADRLWVVYGHVAVFVKNRATPLGHLPLQRVAG